ncbi:MAG: O-antigen ligase family protein [Deltaproteobacteria bacterium]|nr:O-antigen ligase family protein [Deltaproteobacteria bacterium]
MTALCHALSISATQILLGVLIVILFKKSILEGAFRWFETPYTPLVIGVVLSGLLSTLLGVDPSRSIRGFSGVWVMFFLFVGLFLVRKADVPTIFFWLILGGDIAASVVFGQKIGGFYVRGFYSHLLTYGNVISMYITLCGSLMAAGLVNSGKEKTFYAASMVFMGASLILSLERGPIIFTAITLALIILYRFKLKGVVGAGLLIFLVSAAFILTPGSGKSLTELKVGWGDPRTSVGTRLVLWKTAAQLVRKHPVFGIGEENFQLEAEKRIRVQVNATCHAHNAYLQYLVTHGAVGLLALLALFVKMIRDMAKSLFGGREPIVLVGLSLSTVFLLQGLTEDNFSDDEVAMVFWFLSGIVLGCLRSPSQPGQESAKIPPPKKW